MSDYWRWSGAETARNVRNGSVSASAVIRSSLDRLHAVNGKINAVVGFCDEEAQETAAAIDRKIEMGEDPGILAGVPVTIKCNTDQAGHPSTNGLRLQKDLIAETDNPVVANLKKAGAVIVGRTNTPAFSLRWFTRNSLHGHTRNPHDPTLTPGGSSGGASAATASGIGAIGHGTDIGGSVRYPAYACGLNGLRPSLGRIPAVNFTAPDRHIGAQIMAVSGPLARNMDDIELGLAAMSRPDPRDAWYVPVSDDQPALPKRAALCCAPEGLDVDPVVVEALRDAAGRLRDDGWEVDEVDCPSLRAAAAVQAVLWVSDFRRSVMGAIEKEGDPDAIFVIEQLERYAGNYGVEPLMDALQTRFGLVRDWQTFLTRYPVLLLPVSGEKPFPDLLDIESPEAFDRVLEAQLTQVALPTLGIPALTVATGKDGTTPLGVQLVGPKYREDVLIAAGRVLERARPAIEPIDPVTS